MPDPSGNLRIRWRWGFGVAIAMMLIALFPQIHFVISRGHQWHGAHAITHPDEVAYSAYLASLIRGSPRRNDPFTGRGAQSETAPPESLFSIQFVPAYAVAIPARWLHLSASAVFMILPALSAFASSLALFWFAWLLTRDERFSAALVLTVLGFGTLIAGQGIVRYVPNLNYLIPAWISTRTSPVGVYGLPFLRLYQPAVAFPLFFLLCIFVWRALNHRVGRRSALNAAWAGLVLTTLVFSYFYLWTAAAAWLACIALLWFIFRRAELWRLVSVLGIIAALALPGLIGYFVMLSKRAATVDSVQALVLTHRPDLFRGPAIASLIVLLLLAVGSRRRVFQARDPIVLFTASLALTVIAVFNQQVVTGRSLQPIHYEWFIGNYCALAAIVLTAGLWWRRRTSKVLTNKRIGTIAGLALVWGFGEVWLAASVNYPGNSRADEFKPAAERLTSLARANGGEIRADESAVLISDLPLADRLPTDAPQPVLWAPRMLVFPAVSETENRQRFFQQLYYLGYDERKIWRELDKVNWNFYAGLFPYYRLDRAVSGNTLPITPEELRERVRDYLNYLASFDRRRSASPTLSYVVVPADEQFDFQNLDRWYQRDVGERIGSFILYRVRLR
jgi:hypothetical protein